MKLYAVGTLVLIAACGGGDAAPDVLPLFPEDYAAAGYTQVRTCRGSADHDLDQVHILADPVAHDAYVNRTPFPEGSILLKEEYDFDNDTCAGTILGYTVMKKDATQTESIGWHWQRVSRDFEVVTDNELRCYDCHKDCEEGYADTCAAEP